MSRKIVQIKLENVHKYYQETKSQKTKDFLTTLFPDLNKTMRPHKKPGWVKGEKGNNDYSEFLKIEGNTIKKSFTIDQRYVEYHCRIKLKYLPNSFLTDIKYFKEED